MSAILEAPVDGDIWDRLIEPTRPAMPPEAARYFLSLEFAPADRQRMHDLAIQNQAGELTPEGHASLDSFRRVAMQLDLLRAKARASLRHGGNGQQT